MLALRQADIKSLTTILQMNPAEGLSSEDEDMFFPSMHIMLININLVGSSFTENKMGFLKRELACSFKIQVPIVDMLTILL